MKLGQKVMDTVTGFVGVMTARCVYLHGTTRCMVEAMIDGDAKEAWFEESRLVAVEG